jgi:hypothetical protein
VVVDASSVVRDRCASNATHTSRQWEIWLRGCDKDVDKYFTIQFAVFIAMLDWDNATTGLKSLTWDGYGGSVRNCDLLKSEESILRNPAFAPQNPGWNAQWIGRTDLWFAHATLVS